MTQDSLFDASVFVRRAYDQLVLAAHFGDTDELESLKFQCLQTWLSLQEARMARENVVDLQTVFPYDDDPA